MNSERSDQRSIFSQASLNTKTIQSWWPLFVRYVICRLEQVYNLENKLLL
jgi:hypothetical protein